MNQSGKVWALSLLCLVGLIAPACDSDDGGTNSNGGSAGSGSGGKNSAGQTNTGGKDHLLDAGRGGQGGAAGGAGGGGLPDCESPLVDQASGVVTCGEIKYRQFVGKGCSYSPPDMDAQGGGGAGGASTGGVGGSGEASAGCDASKCTEKPRGFCYSDPAGFAGAGAESCHYGCLTDGDCGKNELCLCEDASYGGRCVPALCKTDADCKNGNHCASQTSCDQFYCDDEPGCAVP